MKGGKKLNDLRKKIDSIDGEILGLLNKRAGVVIEIGRLKRDRKATFYSPARERQIIKRLKGLNAGPFPSDALKSVFREILSASLSLEEPLRVACLGPLGTFTHLAGIRHFGSSSIFVPVDSIKSVFEEVERGGAEYGIVPIENSNEGVVSYTLDMFIDYDLKVSAEVMLEVSHNLLSLSGRKAKIQKIFSHPQATAQCKGWLEKNMHGIPVFEAASTAKAASLSSGDPSAAAIASEAAASLYGLKFVQRRIEDRRNNFTRFLVISREHPQRTGYDKTSIMFSIKDRPGALYDVLSPFKKSKINLTKIESRPSRRKAWEYIFFVDMEGHFEEPKIRKAIEEVKKECLFFKTLGSYPCGE